MGKQAVGPRGKKKEPDGLIWDTANLTRQPAILGNAAVAGKTEPQYGPDHPFFYHRKHGNNPPVPLDRIQANAEGVDLSLLSLSMSRPTISRIERLHADARKKLDVEGQRYQDLARKSLENGGKPHARNGQDDEAMTAALATKYCQVSSLLGQVAFLHGMLRRIIE